MYTCSADNASITTTNYDNIDCMGTPTSTTLNASLDFFCGGKDCGLQYSLTAYDTSSTCSGSYATYELFSVVTGMCYTSSGSSINYTCTADSVTVKAYTDSTCSSQPAITDGDTGCTGESDFDVSYTYNVTHCGNPSSQLPSFSAFISFFVMAIAFFIC